MFTRQIAHGIEVRLLEMQDAEELFAMVERNRPYLREWLPWVDSTRSAEDVRGFIHRVHLQYEASQGPQAAIVMDGRIVGGIGCHPIDWSNKNCSIGYWIAAEQQGRGVMTQCAANLIDYLF